MPLEQAAFEGRLQAALVAALIFLGLRFLLVTGVLGWSEPSWRGRSERSTGRTAARIALVLGGLLAAAIAYDAWRGASLHGTRYFVAFVSLTLLGGFVYGRKYACASGVRFQSDDGFAQRKMGTYEMGPPDVVLVGQVVLIPCLAQAGLDGARLWVAWAALVAAAAAGMGYYAQQLHRVWEKDLQVGDYGALADLRDGRRPRAAKTAADKADKPRAREWELAPVLLHASDWLLLALAFFGVPFLLAKAVPAPPAAIAPWLCAAACVTPIGMLRVRRLAVARRAVAAFAALLDAVSRDDPRAAAAAFARASQLRHLGSIAAEALLKRQPAGFDNLMKAFEEGAGHEELIESLWKQGFAHAQPPLDADTRHARFARFTDLLANPLCPARQRGVLLGYMLGDMDAGAQSVFISANPAVFGDAALLEQLELAHGIRLVRQK